MSIRSVKEEDFSAQSWKQDKFYGSYSLQKVQKENAPTQNFVVGPFESLGDASIWLTQEHAKKPKEMLDDFFVLNRSDMQSLLARNNQSYSAGTKIKF